MLEIKNLNCGYGDMQILFGVDMKLEPGELAVIIGPNGSGKSTTLKSIFNLVKIYGGSISYRNKDITNIPTHSIIELGVGFVPQGRQIFGSLTVRENLEMGAFATKSKKIVDRKMKEVLNVHFPELKKKIDEPAFSLSGGQQQMLAIGRALMMEPQLLLLDEPSLGLAPKIMKELFRKIKKINKEGVTILMVEQNAKAACEIASRIFVLEDGKVAMHGGKEIMESEKIRHIYLGGR